MEKYLKKTIVYSNVESQAYVEGVLEYLAELFKSSKSVALEMMAEDYLLPSNASARTIVKKLMSKKITLINALGEIFSMYDLYPERTGGEAFVDLFREMAFLNQCIDTGSALADERMYLYGKFREFVQMVQIKSQIDPDAGTVYDNMIKYGYYLADEIKSEPDKVRIINLIRFINDNGSIIDIKSIVYKIMYSLCKLILVKNTLSAEDTKRFIDLVRSTCDNWN